MIEKEDNRDVYIWDETLRDGEQSPGVSLNSDEKLEIARLLDEIGVSVIAVGFPAVSDDEEKSVKQIVESSDWNSSLLGVARAVESDIDVCVKCGLKEISVFLPTSDLHIKQKLGKDREYVLNRTKLVIEYAVDVGLKLNFVAEDSSRSNLDFLNEVFKIARDAGAVRLVLTDTVGVLTPDKVKGMVSSVKNAVEGVDLAIHCHDDFGLATANTLAAVEAGVKYPHVCVNGYGERAGNACFAEVVLGVEKLLGRKTGVKIENLYELSKTTEKRFMVPIAWNKSIVGRNAFRHESGIHVHGVMKNSSTYESISPCEMNRKREIVLGKHSGVNVLRHKVESMGLELNDGQFEELCVLVKEKPYALKQIEREKFENLLGESHSICGGIDDRGLRQMVDYVIGQR